MLDIRLIREKLDFVRENIKRRKDKASLKKLDELVAADKKWRAGLAKVDKLKHEKNTVTREIAKLKGDAKKKKIGEYIDH